VGRCGGAVEDPTAPLPGLADGGPTPSSGEAELDLAARVRLASLRGAMFGAAAEPPKIGRFVLQEALGAGGMGIVYAAHDPDLERRVALKLVRPDAAAAASSQARLLREAKSMARLSHPNVVQIHEVGVWEGRVFIAMELVPGRTLAAWLAAPGRSWREIVAVFVAAGRGLAAAHEVGVVHRDFKPENVLVGEDGRARVTDFGLARGELGDVTPGDRPASDALADLAGAAVTASGAVMGTPAYMAPELFVGGPATAASDQFSFCVALYHALHGVRPFAGADRAELMRSVIAARREEPARLRIPRAIHRALVRGLAPAPADRFKNMHALLAAIEAPRAWRGVVAGGVVAGVVAGLLAVLRPWEPACEASRSRFETGNSENEYIVPRGCTTIQVQAWGGGGGGAIDPGGGGGYTGATLRVTPGQTLVVAVGNAGTSWAEGMGDSITGGSSGGHGGYAGAGSGGYSGIREGLEWLLVAGGGGGAGAHGGGGGGGGARGEDGLGSSAGGKGGTPEAPGAGGNSRHGAQEGHSGAGMRGGTGGAFPDTRRGDPNNGCGGGAGGGGYMAGGGGGGDGAGINDGGLCGGGGGGSGFVAADRALPDTVEFRTARRQQVERADRSDGAGQGGDGRRPASEASAGRPGLVIITTGA
jgi:hypothetical protein